MISLHFSPHRGADNWDRENFIRGVKNAPTLQDYITRPSFRARLEKKPGLPTRPGPPDRDINYLIRFENLNDDFNEACKRIGLPAVPALPVHNRGNRKHYSRYYDDELKDMEDRKFRNEIEYGDYEFRNDR